MPKLKPIEWQRAHISFDRLNEQLGVARHINQQTVYVAAPSKKAALERLRAEGFSVSMSELRVGMGNVLTAVLAAGFLQREGEILIIALNTTKSTRVVEMLGKHRAGGYVQYQTKIVGAFVEPLPKQGRFAYRVERKED